MLHKIIFLSLFASTSLLAAEKAATASDNNGANEVLLKQVSRGFSRVAKKAIPAVVYIESQTTKEGSAQAPKSNKKATPESPFDRFHEEFFNRFFGAPYQDLQPQQKRSETVRGSGFIVSSDGYIMTNNHVVEKATKIQVTLHGGKKVLATVVGCDPKTDLAVIKIDEKKLPSLPFGDSDKLEVGDWAIAVGNPFGLEASVTVGVVSAKGRNQLHITDFDDFIQTDAAINPGNSGGPLLNIDGEIIGINTAIVSGSGGYMGIGFAIPSNMASRIKDQLIKEGTVTRGWLGVSLQPLDEELAKYYHLENQQGALVSDVMKGSPAEKAGLKQEDIILAYNNTPVDNLSSFRNSVALMPPGTKLNLRVLREGKVKEIEVNIAVLPSEEKKVKSAKLGFDVESLTPEIARELGVSSDKGLVVNKVDPGSPASMAAIRIGSVILAVNHKKVTTCEEFDLAVSEAVKEGRILLMVQEGPFVRFIALTLEE